MSSGITGGDDRFQDAAGAMGEGADTGLEENTSPGVEERRITTSEDRSLLSPDCQPQLSVDDCAVGLADAGHDYSFLPGMVSDALYRPSVIYGVDVFYFELLSSFAEGTVSEKLAAISALFAFIDGSGNRADDHEYARRAGSAGGQADGLCAHSQVSG